jgi:hypothetical protein
MILNLLLAYTEDDKINSENKVNLLVLLGLLARKMARRLSSFPPME